jgi:hypothetical protein
MGDVMFCYNLVLILLLFSWTLQHSRLQKTLNVTFVLCCTNSLWITCCHWHSLLVSHKCSLMHRVINLLWTRHHKTFCYMYSDYPYKVSSWNVQCSTMYTHKCMHITVTTKSPVVGFELLTVVVMRNTIF